MTKPTKSKLLELLKKHNFVKQDVALALGVDEKSMRRWCIGYKIDTDFERKKTILEYEPVVIVPKVESSSIITTPKVLSKCFVFSDLQVPYHSVKALSIAIQRCQDYKPSHVVLIGDVMDYNPLLGKTKQRHPILVTEELKALDLEFIATAKVLDSIEKALPKDCVKIFICGNHEDRAFQIIAKPDGDYWKKHLDIDIRLGLSNRGWKIYKYNESVQLGKLWYTHGAFCNENAAAKHAAVWQKNVLFGHLHRVQVFTMSSPVRELPVWAASIGSLSDMNPEWLRNKPTAYDHAFCEVNYDESGNFYPVIHRIIKGKLILSDGTIYKA